MEAQIILMLARQHQLRLRLSFHKLYMTTRCYIRDVPYYSAAPTISCKVNIQLMPAEESASELSSGDYHASSWSARIFYYGPELESFCTTQGLPSEILDTTWCASCLDILVEWIGFELHISDLAPVGMSHQRKQHRDSLRRTLYVKGSWRCSLLFDITAPLGDITYPTRF